MNNYQAHAQERAQSLLNTVFGWMSFALALTGVTAYYVASTPAIVNYLFRNPGFIIAAAVIQLILVVVLSAAVNRLSFSVALGIFTFYSVLTGVTLSSVFLVYTTGSIAATFFVASATFAVMAIYGLVTKQDLSAMGAFLTMALFGLIIAMVVNLFIRSSGFDLVLAMVGVVIFALLTAWDVQRIKNVANYELPEAAAITLALGLYLNFINLFLDLLRIMGERKNN